MCDSNDQDPTQRSVVPLRRGSGPEFAARGRELGLHTCALVECVTSEVKRLRCELPGMFVHSLLHRRGPSGRTAYAAHVLPIGRPRNGDPSSFRWIVDIPASSCELNWGADAEWAHPYAVRTVEGATLTLRYPHGCATAAAPAAPGLGSVQSRVSTRCEEPQAVQRSHSPVAGPIESPAPLHAHPFNSAEAARALARPSRSSYVLSSSTSSCAWSRGDSPRAAQHAT